MLSEESDTSGGNSGRSSGKSATVAFVDIRSASKALRHVRTVAGQPIQISYYEPGSAPCRVPPPSLHTHTPDSLNSSDIIGTSQGSINHNSSSSGNGTVGSNCIPTSLPSYRQRFSRHHGQSEDSSSHFYDQPKSFTRGRSDGHGFQGSRGRRENRPPYHRHSFPNNDNRNRRSWNYHETRFVPPVHSEIDERSPVAPSPNHPSISESTSKTRRPESPASSVSSRKLVTKRRKSRSVSESGSSERGSSVGSRSRSGSRSSVSTSVSSGRSRSPSHHGHFPQRNSGGRFHQNNNYPRTRCHRSRVLQRSSDTRARHTSRSPMAAASPSSSTSSSPSPHRKISGPHSPSHSPSSSKSFSPSRTIGSHHSNHHRRNPNLNELSYAIKIRNLPIRSSDTSLKDGLYHEYKKHGKVAWVKISGSGQDRFAIVCFKNADHASRAVSASQEKQFFGCKIHVTQFHQSKSDEALLGPIEDDRILHDEDPPSVGYPTRTILLTSLDCNVTLAELKSAFAQYGDILSIDIKKQGSSTFATCEFLDIASAIRAQWGRHVFKSKEAKISFFRNPPSNYLLLDGTTGVSDKEVHEYCSHYGAIKRVVMDPERVLTLVQFEETTSALSAIRQLRSWVIKGKHLQVDFASPEVSRKFLERLSIAMSSPVDSSSPGRVSSPSIGNSVPHDTFRGIVKKEENESKFRENKIDVKNHQFWSERESNVHTSKLEPEYSKSSEDAFGSRSSYTSPVSPDGDSFAEDKGCHSSNLKVAGKSHLDFDCRETDSAIVTSSSDIVIDKDSSSQGVSSDEKLVDVTIDGRRRKSADSNCTTMFVDGVSSTSPEPKNDGVRKASPDSGTTYNINKSRFDPRRKLAEGKVRRLSADSLNTHCVASSQSDAGYLNLPSSSVSVPATSLSANTDEDDSDGRPGTPLHDENPEGCTVFSSEKTSPCETPKVLKHEHVTLPLPEFAHHSSTNQNMESNRTSKQSQPLSRLGDFSRNSNVKSASRRNSGEETPPPHLPSSGTSWEPDSVNKTSVTNCNVQPFDNEVNRTKDSSLHVDSDSVDINDDISSESEKCSPEVGSPRGSLDERIQRCYENYDRLNDSRLSSVSEHLRNSNESLNLSETNAESSSASQTKHKWSLLKMKHKYLDLDELIHRPSDIGKSVLARRSVFDDDSKRLENFGDKYEGKGTTSTSVANSWRAIALQRSMSASSSNIHVVSGPSSPGPRSAPLLGHMPSSFSPMSQIMTTASSTKCTTTVFHSSSHNKSKDLNVNVTTNLKSPPCSASSTPVSGSSFTPNRPNNKDIIPQTPTQPSASSQPPENQEVVKPANQPTPKPQTVAVSTTVSTSCPSPPVVTPLIHQGLPRAVERSTSLDSKKTTLSVCSNNLRTSTASLVQSNTHTPTSTTAVLRRSSVDSHSTNTEKSISELVDKPTIDKKSDKSVVGLSSVAESWTEAEPVKATARTGCLESDTSDCEPSFKEKHDPHVETQLMKRDISGIGQVHQETTVAVVASEQMNFLPGRTDSVGTSNSKDSSKKDKEKKCKSSSNSTLVTSSGATSGIAASVSNLQSVSPHFGNAKRPEEKKDAKKEKSIRTNNTGDSHGEVEESLKKEKLDRKDKKDRKDVAKDHGDTSSQSHKDAHHHHHHHQSHRRDRDKDKDRDSSSKRKRHNSSEDAEALEVKKSKMEKDAHDGNSSVHRSKSKDSNDRKDNRDSTRKESRSSTSGNSFESMQKDKNRDEAKNKESHGRLKNSKEKYPGEKSRNSSDSRSNQVPGLHKDKESKDGSSKEKRKDKVSPGKENCRASNRHHSHHHSSDRKSSQKSKEDELKKLDKHNGHSEAESESYRKKDKQDESAFSSGRSTSGKPKLNKSEKRGLAGKSDRRKSSDENVSERKKSTDRKDNSKDVKKKKKFVIEETESSDSDDDEKKKHHSIFEVVIDEYVSMYDKVKARSNRACKSNTQTSAEDAVKKQDKIKDQLRQLKHSRAKKVEKKRSTSVDESNKSMTHSTTDDESQEERVDRNKAELLDKRFRQERQSSRSRVMSHSSDENDDMDRMKSKSSKKTSQKKRKGSSSEKAFKRKSKKSSKSSGTVAILTNSECETNESDSNVEPLSKRKRLSSSMMSCTDLVKKLDKSSEDSLSDSDDQSTQDSRGKHVFMKRNTEKLNKQTNEMYSESDSSVSSEPASQMKHRKTQSKHKNKERNGKQKSMRKTLFESSGSSEDEEKESKGKEIVPSRNKSKESKQRKKHRSHSSSKVEKSKQRSGSGDSTLLPKREMSTMEDILFGPMTATSESDEEISERPKTPTVIGESNVKPFEDHRSSPRKFSTQKNLRFSNSVSPNSSIEDVDKVAISKSSKKKKHHKDKKSKHEDDSKHREQKNKDLDSLFVSPKSSPIPEQEDKTVLSKHKYKSLQEECIPLPPIAPEISSTTSTSIDHIDIKEETKVMFSSDEDDDDKLKIDINEAIIASSDEPMTDSNVVSSSFVEEKSIEEEEKQQQLNSLFEQDKAIESIVLLERKSPPPTATCPNAFDEPAKEDLPKDCAAISQEETEDAVAALLETLEGDDKVEESQPSTQVKLSSSIHTSVQSPPTLRIIEEPPPSSERQPSESCSGVAIMKVSPKSSVWTPENIEKRQPSNPDVCSSDSIGGSQVELPLPKTPDICARKLSTESSSSAPQEKQDIKSPSRRNSTASCRQSSSENEASIDVSKDIYEFHDSDEEKPKPDEAVPPPTKSPISVSPNSVVDKSQPDTLKPPPVVSASPVTPVETNTVSLPPPSTGVFLLQPAVAPKISETPVTPKNLHTTVVTTGTPTKPPSTSVRSNIDDIIENVVRQAYLEEESQPTPGLTITSVKSGTSRGRSKSRDSVSEEVNSTVSITKVIAPHAPITSQSMDLPQPLSHIKSESDALKTDTATLETLIDPQTGILTPMMRQSDEGQYVPLGVDHAAPKPQNVSLALPHIEAVKIEKDSVVTSSAERMLIVAGPQHQGIKSEGLAATMLSHQQGFPSPSSTGVQLPKVNVHLRVPSSMAQHSPSKGLAPQERSVINERGVHEISVATVSRESVSQSNVTLHPLSSGRPVFASGAPFVPVSSQGGQFQFAVITRSSEPSAVPTSRLISSLSIQPPTQGFSKISAVCQNPNEVTNFQIPSATTITKVQPGHDDSKKTLAGLPLSTNSSPIITGTSLHGNKPFIVTSAAPTTAVSMTHQQHQQHQAQTELFRKAAEGIRVPKEESIIFSKSQDQPSGLAPRVDISVNIAQAAASPTSKPGKIPHDIYQSASFQPRLAQHTIGSTGEVKMIGPPKSTPSEHGVYITSQQAQFSPHLRSNTSSPVCIPATSHATRVGSLDHQIDLKHFPLAADRSRPTPMHSAHHPVPPHANETRSSDSPLAPPIYALRQGFQTPAPAHQSSSRDNYKMFPESASLDRPISHSPSYSSSPFDNRAGSVPPPDRDSTRIMSPYTPRDMTQRGNFSPPPAHGRYSSPQSSDNSGALERPRPTNGPSPPLTQVPSQGDSLLMLLQRYPIMWQGLLALKNDNAACQMHFVSGNLAVARDSLPANPDGSIPPLRISQRMRLEQTQLEGVARKMQMEAEHCILLALPCGRDHMDVLKQSNNLRTGFITYLQLKQAAGIVNICNPVNQQTAYVIHIFPSCDFANENLARIAPDLLHGVADIAHLLIVIATV